MKKIVLLCDGTWNRSDSKTPTNVVLTSHLLADRDDDGNAQLAVYVPGVGSGEGSTRLSRFLDKALGGAFGFGLLDNIIEIYRHLVFLYEPGDQIYIFGFSRGAFTARSLGGFIWANGILDRTKLNRMPAAVTRYRQSGETGSQESDEAHAYRADVSPGVARTAAEQVWRRAHGKPEGHLLKIAYMGIWDTVGALGIPRQLSPLGLLTLGSFQFHDTDLSPLVRSARHAVAVDERRNAYDATLWNNLPDLNAGRDDVPYRQLWFPGDHGSVGGGGDIRDLSNITLDWVLAGGVAAGLTLRGDRLKTIQDNQNPFGPVRNRRDTRAGLVDALTRLIPHDRDGPEDVKEVHQALVDRWQSTSLPGGPYRPKTLNKIAAALDALPPP